MISSWNESQFLDFSRIYLADDKSSKAKQSLAAHWRQSD